MVILNEPADHPNSIRILEENGLRLPTYKEVLTILTENSELKEQLKGKWFWISGTGNDIKDLLTRRESSAFFTFDSQGSLTRGKGQIEETVSVVLLIGDSPLSFYVHTDADASSDWRFALRARSPSDYVASAVVGVPR